MAVEYKRVAASRPANTSEAELYAVPALTELIGKLTIVNQNSTVVTFSAAHTDVTGAATGEDWVAYLEPLQPYGRRVIHFNMGPAETIRIQASVADKVSFVLDGMLKT